jgi:homoserine kinase
MRNHVRLKIPTLCGNLGPGYDTFGMALNFYNYLDISITKFTFNIEITGDGSDFLPTDTSNVVYKAMSNVFKKRKTVIPGIDLKLENNIPVCHGLGSYAGAVAAGMIGANYLLGEPYETMELLTMAVKKVGSSSNLAAAFLGGFVICSKQEEYFLRIDLPSNLKPVLFIPNIERRYSVDAKRNIPKNVPIEDANYNISHAALLVTGLLSGELSILKKSFNDKLVNPQRQSFFPGLRDVFLYLNSSDNMGVSLCNDGPSFVVFFDREKKYKRHITKIKNILSEYDISLDVKDLEIEGAGIRIDE